MAMIPDNSRGILVHTCCAWCLLDVLGPLSRDYGRIVVGFFNPNIHPRAEFEKRMKSARLLCRRLELELVCDGQYGLVPFLNSLYNAGIDPAGERGARCGVCYGTRMRRTAEEARRLGLGAFTTTLLSSPHQLQEELRRAGESAAREFGAGFDGREMVSLHGTGRDQVPSGLTLHRQRYCGCIFSECEAFKPSGD